ncbi:MAG TPA: Rv3235 family protein [Actinomadura sp.]|nr:Rv3235 family protein [Actinomadura sp.]
MNRRTPRRSAVRLLAYPARRLEPVQAMPRVDGSLALAPVPTPHPAEGHRRPGMSHLGGRQPPRPLLRPAPGPADRAHPAETDLATTAEVVIRLAFEAFAGRRPLHHLTRWVTLKVAQELSHQPLPEASAGRVAPPRILASWIQTPAPGRAEVGAVAQVGTRVQALALRLERLRGRWRCLALETTVPPPGKGVHTR